MGQLFADAAHYAHSAHPGSPTRTMKWPDLPTGAEKPSWGGLFGAMGAAYVFIDPYRLDAAWSEWVWTGLAFALCFSLAVLSSIYWSRKPAMRRVCMAMAVLAAVFTTYRPSGIVFYVFVAALGPLAVGGNIARSAAIVGTVVLLMIGEWRLLWPPNWMPYVLALEAVLIGAALTAVVRQNLGVRRILKTAERERIARDLHDILGHTLSVIILKSELAGRLLEQEPARARVEIGDVERISRRALSEVRDAISGYHAGDLQAELDRARAVLETASIAVECHSEALSMPVAHERVLALALREAITNVVRHSQAKSCRLTLQERDGAFQLEVRDDGRGSEGQEGMGIRGIRERVAAIGGSVRWSAGSGTELIVTVPVLARASGEAG